MSEKQASKFKYKCRGCPVQEQCIDQTDLPQGAKEMIRNAFSAKTDTLSTWGVLQRNCLLVKRDEELERRAKKSSLALSRRINEAKSSEEKPEEPAVEEAEEESEVDSQAQVSVMIGSHPDQSPPSTAELDNSATGAPTTDLLDKSSKKKKESPPSQGTRVIGTQRLTTAPLDEQPISRAPAPYWLIIQDSQRRISLPSSGELILGRFDPYLKDPLDVDLTFEDQNKLTVSRRHAKVVGAEGNHTIKDLGSSNGLSVNGVLVMPGQTQPLQPGDRISVGGILMSYEAFPSELLGMLVARAAEVRHLLYLTHSGHKIEISPSDHVTIGRSDPDANFTPSIDLSRDGEIATYVSRRHGVITWNKFTPSYQDLDSTFGTRLNGQALPPNRATPLQPGDHLSLGGCVLAYDVQL